MACVERRPPPPPSQPTAQESQKMARKSNPLEGSGTF